MKKILFLFSIILYSFLASGRQGAIDATTLNNWRIVQGGGISNNGAFVHYLVLNWHTGYNSLFIQATASGTKTEVPNGSNPMFSDDSRWIIYRKPDDSIILMSLNNFSVSFTRQTEKYTLFKLGEKEVIACMLKGKKQLLIYSIANGMERTIDSVNDYKISKDGTGIICIMENENLTTLNRITPVNWKRQQIWTGKGRISSFIVSPDGASTAFVLNAEDKSLWYFHVGNNIATKLADNSSSAIENTLTLGDLINFSLDDRQIFFYLRDKPMPAPPAGAVPVDIWSYKDPKLQSMQLKEHGEKNYLAVIDNQSKNITRLQQQDELISSTTDVAADSLLFVTHRSGDINEVNWNPAARPDCYIVNIHTGKRLPLPLPILRGSLSPGGRFFIGTDSVFANIYAYDVVTRTVQNLTSDLLIPEKDTLLDRPWISANRILHNTGWLEGDKGLLVYDSYDIWLIDPLRKKPPVCITGKYGRKNNISFRIGDIQESLAENQVYKPDSRLILDAFDNETKEDGYYSIKINHPGTPLQLTMSAYIYSNPQNSLYGEIRQLKSRNKFCYIVPKCSSTESPNYYFTTDFRKFKPLSNIHPEQTCKWMYTHLLSWLTPSGKRLQGILYLPNDFDSTKKYPVILSYYEKRSDELNSFQQPGLTGGLLNIPWFVSRNYLVFIPDIYYNIGHPGESILESMTSAADCISKYPWVDSTGLGLQGHSWSGYETNYIITYSTRFAAAVSGAGPSDFVSNYGAVLEQGGMSAQFFFEMSQCRIGKNLYERPDLYIENSPVFKLKDVTTPVLLVHNINDGIVPVNQGLEMFLGLRRMNRKAWMLQYANEGHLIPGWQTSFDYTTRIGQFFDYFLKKLPPPLWMTDGIPAKLKGLEPALDININGKTP